MVPESTRFLTGRAIVTSEHAGFGHELGCLHDSKNEVAVAFSDLLASVAADDPLGILGATFPFLRYLVSFMSFTLETSVAAEHSPSARTSNSPHEETPSSNGPLPACANLA